MNFKLIFSFLLCCILLSITSLAQNESTKIAELNLKIKEAASAGNYEKAAELNKVKKLYQDIASAVAKGDYEKASALKKQLPPDNDAKIESLKKLQQDAANKGDYDTAAQLGKLIEIVKKNPNAPINTSTTTTTTVTKSSGTGSTLLTENKPVSNRTRETKPTASSVKKKIPGQSGKWTSKEIISFTVPTTVFEDDFKGFVMRLGANYPTRPGGPLAFGLGGNFYFADDYYTTSLFVTGGLCFEAPVVTLTSMANLGTTYINNGVTDTEDYVEYVTWRTSLSFHPWKKESIGLAIAIDLVSSGGHGWSVGFTRRLQNGKYKRERNQKRYNEKYF